MKRKIVCLILIMLLTVPFASASFFDDAFERITGWVADGGDDRTVNEPEAPVEPETPDELETPDEPETPPEEPETPDEPEEECSSLAISMWCPDCNVELHGRDCLCPGKVDEKGCSVWDCASCEPIPEEPPEPELICCKTWPVVPEPAYSYDWKPRDECPPLKDGMPPLGQGYSAVDDNLCEKEPGPPIPPIEVPPGCRLVVLENGMEAVECEKECPDIPEAALKKCEESGGKVLEKTDHKGCPFIECEYEVGEQCPSDEGLAAKKESCLDQGLEPMIVRKGECDVIKCRKPEPEQRCAESIEVRKEIKEKCAKAGGEVVKKFDDRGCPVTVCIYPDEEEECSKDIPDEAYENCEVEEGDLMVKRDSKACIVFVDCVKRGKEEVEYEDVEDIPSPATLLSIALKLEGLKIDFDKLTKKVGAIAKYYESTGDVEEAARFRKVAALFSSAIDKIDEIKVEFRENAEGMTKEDLRELKYDMKYVSEVIMRDALYLILGGEIDVGGSTGRTREGYADCGSDGRCWSEAVRVCEPVVYKQAGEPPIRATIHGIGNEFCIIEVSAEGHSMVCKVKDYATLDTSGPEPILQYCEGSMVGWLRSGVKPDTIEMPKEGVCVDRCGDNICQQVVCKAEGCSCPESSESCPKDCGPVSTEFKLCTEEDEKAWDECENEGGNPQTDPSRYGNCEIYTHCEIPHSTEAECETISDIEIKNDCYIKVADLTGDSSVCEKVTVLGRKDKCYLKAATTSGDESVCENIADEGIRDDCRSYITEDFYKPGKKTVVNPEIEGEVVFTEDFEEGLGNWIFYDEHGTPNSGAWTTTVEDGTTVARGTGHNWMELEGPQWTNYIFTARFKLIDGGMHFNYRLNKEGGFRRYYLGVLRDWAYLTKSVPPGHVDLAGQEIQIDDGWHTFKMVGYGNLLNIYIDDVLVIDYKDVGTTALPGGIAFETLDDSEFLVDDIKVQISGEKDLV